MWTRSLTDDGNQLSGYAEMTLSRRVSGFAFGVLALGNERQEFSSLIGSMVSVGVRIALP
jgi:hypothetical protein